MLSSLSCLALSHAFLMNSGMMTVASDDRRMMGGESWGVQNEGSQTQNMHTERSWNARRTRAEQRGTSVERAWNERGTSVERAWNVGAPPRTQTVAAWM